MFYSPLMVFGCKAFVHIPKIKWMKFDDRAVECIFLGYDYEQFSYRLWDHKIQRLIQSRDVVFMDDQMVENIRKEKVPQDASREGK